MRGITLFKNPVLISAVAIGGAKYSGRLEIDLCPKLACVPPAWPTIDSDCTPAAIDACKLESITGMDPRYGLSINIQGRPLISSLKGLSRLGGDLPGGLYIGDMDTLTTLDGFDNIKSVGIDFSGNTISMRNNKVLTSATALSGASYRSGTLSIESCPKLVCTPPSWPETIKAAGQCHPENGGPSPTIIAIAVVAAVCGLLGIVFIWKRRNSSAAARKSHEPRSSSTIKQVNVSTKSNELSNPAYTNEHSKAGDVELRTMAMSASDTEQPQAVANPTKTEAAKHTHTVAFDDLRQATNNFDDAHRIGKGASCVVYKTTLHGKQCAVKVLSSEAQQWQTKQFATEVEFLTNVKHPCLVQLYAYSIDGPQKCLVLEYTDGPLDQRLVAKDKPALGWQQRVDIIVSACRALEHLHSLNPPIFHRDIKSSNILIVGYSSAALDHESVAKVSDFGTVREDDRNRDATMRTSAKTHASTKQIVGTSPYMPNEYTLNGHISEKTDAFALGIVIIELLISEAYDHENDPGVAAHTFCVEARALVNDSDGSKDLAVAIKAKYKHAAAGGGGTRTVGTTGWRSSSRAKQAAKAMTDIAVKCVKGANKRSTPAELLPELEAVAKLAQRQDSDLASSWLGGA
eukprot:g2794.t1